MSARSLIFYCAGSQLAIRSLRSGNWRQLASPLGEPLELGDYWAEYNIPSCDPGGEHCNYQRWFMNLDTGTSRVLHGYHPGGTVAPDLNLPGLVRPLCAPLKVPVGPQDYDFREPARLAFEGSIVVRTDLIGRPEPNLRRCGSTKTLALYASGFASVLTPRALVFQLDDTHLQGVALPSEHLFTTKLPRPLQGTLHQIGIAGSRLLVQTRDGRVWDATFPSVS
jgi:hypothetical protein